MWDMEQERTVANTLKPTSTSFTMRQVKPTPRRPLLPWHDAALVGMYFVVVAMSVVVAAAWVAEVVL